MEKILISAGTTEGRQLSEFLSRKGFCVTACVATQYGEQVLPKLPGQQVRSGRMEEGEMAALIREEGFRRVVDATHPYAQEVSKNIRAACETCGAEYLRLLRAESRAEDCVVVPDTDAAARYLCTAEGNALLTTGSKELGKFTCVPEYQTRLFARVLSTAEVVSACEKLGFSGKNLIAMQGPFTAELDAAMLRQVGAKYLVTKDSGKVGGFPEKLRAAKEAGAKVVLIARPAEETGYSYSQLVEYLTKEPCPKAVALVGIGMGGPDTMTAGARRALDEAELVIGAKRMLEAVKSGEKETFSAYNPEIIREYVAKTDKTKIAVALSGDVGFYSGAKRLQSALGALPGVTVTLIPGISTVAYFCARLGISWDDCKLVSLHGRQENLLAAVRENRKVFCLTGGKDGVNSALRLLAENGLADAAVHVGCDLSYETETIISGTAGELADQNFSELCAAVVENPRAAVPVLTPCIPDEAFIRGDVPMTKEEIRTISLGKLRLTEKSIVYDVGAGTGSVSVEAARLAKDGWVYAIEWKEEACGLIRENCKKFGISNLTVVPGLAPEAMEDLPTPTHVFLGGTAGNMREILTLALEKNPGVRIVVNTIALESTAEALEILKSLPVKDLDIVQISCARGRGVGKYHLMTAQNPVTVFSCTGEDTP